MGRYIWPPLPETWDLVRFGDIAKISYGKALKAEHRQAEGTLKVYGSGGIVGTHDSYLHAGPSIIIGRKGTVGAVYYTDEPFWCIDTAYFLEKLDERANLEYLGYLLRFIDLTRLTIVVGVPGLNRNDLESVKIPLPSPPEQKRIVEMLKQAEALCNLKREILDQTAQLPTALFLKVFGEPANWGLNKVKLGKIALFVTSGSRDWSRYYSSSENDAKFIRVQNIKAGQLDLSDMAFVTPPENTEADRAKVQPGDLLISITGTVGQVAIAPETLGEAYISQHVALVRTDGSLPTEYLAEFLNHPAGGQLQIQRANYGQTKPGLNLQQIRNLQIPLFDENEIEQFLAARSDIAGLKYGLEATTSSLELLQQNLLHQAFRGELTRSWREDHSAEIEERLRKQENIVERKKKRVSIEVIAPLERQRPSRPARRWLMDQLSGLQYGVYLSLGEWKGTLIPSDDLDRFLEQFPVEHMEDTHDQVLRALDQLAGVGLIVSVSVPNQASEYVTGFRVVREDELTKSDDLDRLKVLS